MLSRFKRLNLNKEFSYVSKGKKLEVSLVKLFYREAEGLTKIGISVSSKVFPLAVERNRARRLVSWGLEQIHSRLKDNLKIIVMPKKDILNKSSIEVEKEISDLLEKENLFKE